MKWILGSLLIFSSHAWAGTWESRSFEDLNYKIFLPIKKNPNASSSLMITLHGCAQKADDLVARGNWDEAADRFSTVVVAPQVPGGGVIFGCWDYYGANHTDQNHYHKSLFDLISFLLKDPQLKIDSLRVYVSGLSSGAGEALLLTCLHPDLIAGAGLNSSPAVPSEASDTSHPPIDGAEMAKFCQGLAGTNASFFQSQTVSVLTADQDPIVNVQHSKVIVDAFRAINHLQNEKEFDLSKLEGSNKEGTGTVYSSSNGKPQLSLIINKGIGHNWAAGSGTAGIPGAYITQNSINYPAYLLDFLEKSNLRRSRINQ
jgi:poly(3-hydroxybutyrate) depolymerase